MKPSYILSLRDAPKTKSKKIKNKEKEKYTKQIQTSSKQIVVVHEQACLGDPAR